MSHSTFHSFSIPASPAGRRAFLSITAAVFLCLSVAVSAQSREGAGGVKGKITVTKSDAGDDELKKFLLLNRYATNRALPSNALSDPRTKSPYRLSEKAVISLSNEKIDRQKYPTESKRPVLNQRDLVFRPQVLPVLVGTTVEFPNEDNLFHNVFSYSQTREFDLGRYPKGESRSVKFDEPGIVKVYCDIHAHMNAVILVLENPYFATPEDDGRYAIRDVPDGTYTMTFWYGRDAVDTRKITIRNGETVTADFRY